MGTTYGFDSGPGKSADGFAYHKAAIESEFPL